MWLPSKGSEENIMTTLFMFSVEIFLYEFPTFFLTSTNQIICLNEWDIWKSMESSKKLVKKMDVFPILQILYNRRGELLDVDGLHRYFVSLVSYLQLFMNTLIWFYIIWAADSETVCCNEDIYVTSIVSKKLWSLLFFALKNIGSILFQNKHYI